MRFLVLCVCIGVTVGANIGKRSEATSTTTNPKISDPGQEQFEVISLNSYDVQNPLIIRSRIPESLKPTEADLKSGGRNILAPPSNGQLITSVESLQAGSQLPSSSLTSTSNYEAQLSGIVQNSALNAVPTISIEQLSDLSSVLNSESAFGVGLTSLEIKAQQNPESSLLIPQLPKQQTSQVLIPAQLKYSTVGRTDLNQQLVIASQSEAVQKSDSTQTNEHTGYTIEKVPEIASYSRIGPFSQSDIPSFSEIEAIFNNATQTTPTENPNTEDYSEFLRSRPGNLKNIEDKPVINTVGNLTGKLYNIVNITAANLSGNNTSNEALSEVSATQSTNNSSNTDAEYKVITNIISNEIDIENETPKSEKNIPQPLSIAFDSNVTNTVKTAAGESTTIANENDALEDEVLISNIDILSSSTERSDELLEVNEEIEASSRLLDSDNSSPINILGNLTIDSDILSNNEIVLSSSNDSLNLDNPTENRFETTTLEVTDLPLSNNEPNPVTENNILSNNKTVADYPNTVVLSRSAEGPAIQGLLSSDESTDSVDVTETTTIITTEILDPETTTLVTTEVLDPETTTVIIDSETISS